MPSTEVAVKSVAADAVAKSTKCATFREVLKSRKCNAETLFGVAVAKSAPKSIAGFAQSIGLTNVNDIEFRRAVTHYAQGTRVLAPYAAALRRANDPSVYVEFHGRRASTDAPATPRKSRKSPARKSDAEPTADVAGLLDAILTA
jgi:hypothetical protein